MTPERWQQVEKLFHSALEREPGQRSAFLDQACAGDEQLGKEIKSLIASHEKEGGFIDAPPFEAAARVLTEGQCDLTPGYLFSHYKILSLLGAGGMGRVYLAQDTRLGRKLALKMLPASLTADPELVRRFEQEAQAASALNHPNILTIYDIGDIDGIHFIATEYIEGETLRQHMARKAMSMGQGIGVVIQVASALEAAHQAGIVHRDIKPENVMLRPDGYVKVLDFGLAKLSEGQTARRGTESGVVTAVKTESGVVMGTVNYMSPEQARGQAVDARTDIFSLGVVIYEMVTGHVPFEGETSSHVIVAILEKKPPPLTYHLPEAPAELQRIIGQALRKDRAERYQAISDFLVDLKYLGQELEFAEPRKGKDKRHNAEQESNAGPPDQKPAEGSESRISTEGALAVPGSHRAGEHLEDGSGRSKPRHRFAKWRFAKWLAVASIVGIIVAVALVVQWGSPPPPRIGNTIQLTNDGRDKFQLATDGSRLYFSGVSWPTAGFSQVSTTGGEATLIPAPFLEGPGTGLLYDISRDRTELLVGSMHADSKEGPELWVTSVLGGRGRKLGDLRGHSACWSPDNRQVAYANGPDLYVAKSDGTEARKLVTPPASGIAIFPSWSPDGRLLRFNMVDFEKDTGDLWEEGVDGTGLHPLLPEWKNGGWGGRWSPDGRYYIFLVGSDLRGEHGADIWAIRETKSFFGKVDRKPIQLTFGPLGFSPPVFSPDGKKIFTMAYLPRGELARYDIPTKHWAPFLSGISVLDVDFSRDGKWVTYVTYPEGPLWRSRADGSQRMQLTSPEIRIRVPRWSPDGKRIAFSGKVSGQPSQIYVVSAEAGSAEPLIRRSCDDTDPTWSPDGNRLVFAPGMKSSCAAGIYLFDLSSRQVSTIPGSDGLFSPRWSPDGNSIIAMTAAQSGLMLFSFATQRWEEAVKGYAAYPAWSLDGKFVYFMNETDVLRVRVADHKVEKVVSLGDLRLKSSSGISLTPDGSPLVLREISVRELYALDWIAP